MKTATYRPEAFDVSSVEEARQVILTPDGEADTEARWQRETPYLTSLITDQLDVGSSSVVVDYGCGVGRVSAALIDATGCKALGVDISSSMRALAAQEVPSPHFAATSRSLLETLCDKGFRADAAVAVWVLQHIPLVEDDIALLRKALRPGGRLLVVNLDQRAIPTDAGWFSDGKDIRAILRMTFKEIAGGKLSPDHVGQRTAAHSFWALYA